MLVATTWRAAGTICPRTRTVKRGTQSWPARRTTSPIRDQHGERLSRPGAEPHRADSHCTWAAMDYDDVVGGPAGAQRI